MASVVIATVGRDPVVTISEDHDKFRFTCDVHRRADWCEDMANATGVSAADAAQIAAIGEDPVTVIVPLMPSENVWALVKVQALHRGGMHSVMLATAEGRDEHIGTLAPGEGRYAIRATLFDWLRFRFTDAPNCAVKTHALGKGSRHFRRAAPRPREDDPTWADLLDTYSIITTTACRACAEYLDPSSDVPEI